MSKSDPRKDRRRKLRRASEISAGPEGGLAIEVSTGHRHERLTHLLHDELGALLRDEAGDPLLRGLRVVAVVLSVDYGHARVAVAPPTPTDRGGARRIEAALLRATGYLRAQVAQALDLKRVPQLRFHCDERGGPMPDG